ncbi:LytR family transcriptional regulator [Clavibacter lycopersici]|uniref:LytR family transcriptional regulator n=1 Tax=Clavibacter lycopersici TaxID=2301718 RepID=A0A399TBX2_9MICO|nr:LytR C-terminal domain-containing protein [Clavibacter lycopersici]RIJ52305.1 LytR family transcriptional regulator [Clavibacter lycopersici]RIJ62301.1 LytR family transcriptional regulator [Clavibacter lycopersici]
MPSHAPDRFDDVPGDLSRVGAHRAPRPRHHRFRAFAWAALATGLLVGVGVVGLFVIDDRVSFTDIIPSGGASEEAAPTESPTAAPTAVPGMIVTVLNGTRTSGLSARAATTLESGGWKIGSRANANTTDITTTTVYYYDAADEGAARGLVAELGVGDVAQSEQFRPPAGTAEAQASKLTAVLGADYAAKG